MTEEGEDERIVALIDMDCFYVQVMVRERPELKGKPVVVLQYSDALDGGSTAIAVSYEARRLGVKRGMRKKEIETNPVIELLVMPNNRKKADLSMFRAASSEVMAILAQHATIFERASIDEAFIDITANVKRMIGLPINKSKLQKTYIAGYEGTQEEQLIRWSEHVAGSTHYCYDYKLTLAAVYVDMIRAQILADTQFTCSAGVGTNKIVAKLAAGTHKPDSQTLISPDNIPALYQTINFTKIRNFGGKLGKTMQEELEIEWASELVKFSQAELISRYGDKTGTWIYNIARGVDTDPVKHRSLVKQTACAKNFPQGIRLVSELEQWVGDLAEELEGRLAFELTDNKRIATQFTAHMKLQDAGSVSTQMPLVSSDSEQLVSCAMKCVNKRMKPSEGVCGDVIYMLSIGAGKFVPAPDKDNIFTMLRNMEIKKTEVSKPDESGGLLEDAGNESVLESKESDLKTEKLSGFFEKLKTEAGPSAAKSPENSPTKSPVTVLESVNKENNRHSWNSLSEADTKIMLEPSDGNKKRCPVCCKPVLANKLSEHLDFHTALTLQRQIETELRQQEQTASPKRKLPPNKRGRASKQQKLSSVQSRDITSFFKKT